MMPPSFLLSFRLAGLRLFIYLFMRVFLGKGTFLLRCIIFFEEWNAYGDADDHVGLVRIGRLRLLAHSVRQ